MNEKKMIKKVMLFANGSLACFDEKDEQMPEFQKNLLAAEVKTWIEQGVIEPDSLLYITNHVDGIKFKDWFNFPASMADSPNIPHIDKQFKRLI